MELITIAYADDFIPELWATPLLDTLDKSLVLAGLVNTNYQGLIQNVGDTVRIQKPGAINVGAYTQGSNVTWQAPTSSTQSLVINNDQYFAFSVDDLDALQSNVSLLRAYTDRAAYSLADAIDQDIAAEYTNAGLTDITATLGTDDLYDKFVDAGRQLDEANVPRMGRWVVVTPKGYAQLLKNTNFIHATVEGDRILRTGEIGTIAGFTVFMSNNLVTTTTNVYKYMYGTRDGITHARQLTGGPEAIRREDVFEIGIRGRLAWGNKVVQSTALGTITATEA